MENLLMSKNKMYIVTPDNVYSIVEDKTYSINEMTIDKWLDIFKENSIYSIKNKLIGITEMASYHRKVSYQIIENYDYDTKSKLMLEYEGKFGNMLLLENSVLMESWLGDAWDWTKKTASQAGSFLVDRVKGYGTGAIKMAKDLGICVTTFNCSPLFEDFREILFSPEGIAIETFLAATGIGDIGPIVAWGMMGLWDISLLLRNDTSFSWLNLILDILGMGLGTVAKGFRSIFGGAAGVSRTAGKGIGEVVAEGMKNPATKGVFTKLGELLSGGLSKIMGPLKSASEFLSKKLKLSWAGKAIDAFTTQIAKIMDAIGVKSVSKGAKNVDTLKGAIKSSVKQGANAAAIMGAAETETGKNVMNKVASVFSGNKQGRLNQTLDNIKNVQPVAGIEY